MDILFVTDEDVVVSNGEARFMSKVDGALADGVIIRGGLDAPTVVRWVLPLL